MTGDTEIEVVAMRLVPVPSELGEGSTSQTNVRTLQSHAVDSYPLSYITTKDHTVPPKSPHPKPASTCTLNPKTLNPKTLNPKTLHPKTLNPKP